MRALHFTIMLILDLNNYAKKVGLHDDGGLWVAIVSALNTYCVLILPRNEIALEDVIEYELNFMVLTFMIMILLQMQSSWDVNIQRCFSW